MFSKHLFEDCFKIHRVLVYLKKNDTWTREYNLIVETEVYFADFKLTYYSAF